MGLVTLFGKLQEYEMKLKRLVDDEECDKKNRKSLTLKVKNTKDIKLVYEGNEREINEDM